MLTETNHYWLPVPDRGSSYGLTRHAFRGRRWDGRTSETSVCGEPCVMTQPSEMDWVQGPTCIPCNDILVNEVAAAQSFDLH